MRRRFAVLAVAAVAVATFGLPPAVQADVQKTDVSFEVTYPGDPLNKPWTIKGFMMRPAGCTSSVLLALHGLSYGQWAWDFPLYPETLSVARALAARGYAMIAIDELGYGESHREEPNGYTLTVEAYAAMTAQIIEQIRAGSYGGPAFAKVGLLGHSAGSEISELTTGLYPHLVDALIATAYTHVPFMSAEWLQREWFTDNQRALEDDYEEFETNQSIRDADMYYLPKSDSEVRQLDWDLHNQTPSGEVLSINMQPSRFVAPTIDKPVLLLLAEKDVLFPGSYGPDEMLLFSGSPDATLKVVPEAGHVFMLEHNAPIANDMIADWLEARPGVLPACP